MNPPLQRQRSELEPAHLRTCQECGMVCDQPGEFHPYMFCVLKKAGRNPWDDFAWAVKQATGQRLPTRPPAVRDLPLTRAGGKYR